MRRIELTTREQQVCGINSQKLFSHFKDTRNDTKRVALSYNPGSELLTESSDDNDQIEITFTKEGTSDVSARISKGKLPLIVKVALQRANSRIKLLAATSDNEIRTLSNDALDRLAAEDPSRIFKR